MAAAVLLQGVPANPSGAVAYQLKEALGLVCTPQLLLSPPTPGGMCSAMCFFGSATDREKVLAVGVVAVFGVRVRVSAGVGQASKPTPAPKRIRMTVDASGNEELMDDAPDEPEVDERIRRALLGMQAGDAIAAPIHWYYTIDVMKEHLRDHFGAGPDGLRHYAAVPSALHGKHPDSWNYMKVRAGPPLLVWAALVACGSDRGCCTPRRHSTPASRRSTLCTRRNVSGTNQVTSITQSSRRAR
jgi:hypothetical protein